MIDVVLLMDEVIILSTSYESIRLKIKSLIDKLSLIH